jgi:hypothetical protein
MTDGMIPRAAKLSFTALQSCAREDGPNRYTSVVRTIIKMDRDDIVRGKDVQFDFPERQ